MDKITPRLRAYIHAANVPVRFRGMQFKDLEDSTSKDVVKSWLDAVKVGKIVESPGELCGRGMVLVGEPGHGKTTLAAIVLQSYLIHVADTAENRLPRPGYFTTYAELLRLQQQHFDDPDDRTRHLLHSVFAQHEDSAQNVAVLVIDDLGKEHRTDSGWAVNTFDLLLRRRYDLGLPTIVTTNVPISDWSSIYGPAMESFSHEALFHVPVTNPGGDRRRRSIRP